MKKVLVFVLIATVILATVLTGCGQKEEQKEPQKDQTQQDNQADQNVDEQTQPVTINLFHFKVEIQDEMMEMKDAFEKENPDIKLNVETVGGGADYYGMLSSKFASGDEPDLFAVSGYADLILYKDKLEDLSDQPWVSKLPESLVDAVTIDGQVLAQTQAVEGFGYAYNKALFEQAGITETPKTLSQLEDACIKLQDIGVIPFSNDYFEWWVLGNHFINTILSNNQPDPLGYTLAVMNGEDRLVGNSNAEGALDLLSLTLKYGQDNPLTTDYNTTLADFASGKVAMIQQGNWIQPEIDKLNPGMDVAFLPMPVSEDPVETITAGGTVHYAVNKNSQGLEQAKTFLNWNVTSDTGMHIFTDVLKFIPIYSGMDSTSLSPLNSSINDYINQGNVTGWVGNRLTGGQKNDIGAALQAYIGGTTTKEETLTNIEDIMKGN